MNSGNARAGAEELAAGRAVSLDVVDASAVDAAVGDVLPEGGRLDAVAHRDQGERGRARPHADRHGGADADGIAQRSRWSPGASLRDARVLPVAGAGVYGSAYRDGEVDSVDQSRR
ncbi:hypothetical protein ACFV3R_11820 [Streptomyces sp. NPDC059740]|uniref:hypothetical protein n=1 Tax=Streptomyces sp. NPDC059740 TaxID=3346926 RepID=UPI0036578455